MRYRARYNAIGALLVDRRIRMIVRPSLYPYILKLLKCLVEFNLPPLSVLVF